jgi:hypothetical protein
VLGAQLATNGSQADVGLGQSAAEAVPTEGFLAKYDFVNAPPLGQYVASRQAGRSCRAVRGTYQMVGRRVHTAACRVP